MKGVPKSCFCAAESCGGDGNFDIIVSNTAVLLVACVSVFSVLCPFMLLKLDQLALLVESLPLVRPQ